MESSFAEHEVASSNATELTSLASNGNKSQIRNESDSEEHPARWYREKKQESQESTVLWDIVRSLNVLTNGRFSVSAKDVFLIFGSSNHKKTAW